MFGLSKSKLMQWAKHAVKRRIRRTRKIVRRLGRILAFGAVLLVLSIFSLHNSTEAAFAIVQELGVAIIIAVILFILLEEWAAREHGKTAIGYMYGIYPARYFFDKIEAYVLLQQVYRGLTVVEYAFEEQAGENVLVRYCVEYEVRNISKKHDPGEFTLTGSVAKKRLNTGPTPWDDRLGLVEVKVRVGDDPAPLILVPLTAFDITEDAPKLIQSYVEKQFRSLDYNTPITVRLTHYLVRHNHDSIVWHAALPSYGVRLEVTWPADMHLDLAYEVIHPDEGSLNPTRADGRLTLELKEPFLVDHGFHFWWSPQAPGSDATSTQSKETQQAPN